MKITKKFFKDSDQRNIHLALENYTESQLRYLWGCEKIDYFSETDEEDIMDRLWVVFLSDVDRIEVELDEYGWLSTVAYLKDGTRLYVEI